MGKGLLEKYSDSPAIRALVAAFPHIGSSIDILLNEKGTKWRRQRVEECINNYGASIEDIIKTNKRIEDLLKKKIDTEAFYDLLFTCLRESALTRHKEKISGFSNILANYTCGNIHDDDADLFIILVSDVSITEFKLLVEVSKNNQVIYHQVGKGMYIDIAKLIPYYEKNKSHHNINDLPPECLISSNTLVSISRLENRLLISREESHVHEYHPYTIRRSSQASTESIESFSKMTITLTDFGYDFLNKVSSPSPPP